MNIKKIVSFMLVTVLTLAALSGCGKVSGSGNTIGFLPKQLDGVPYWESMNNGIKNAASKYGYTVVTKFDKDANYVKQKELMKEMINDKVSAIILAPDSVTELIPEIKEANKANIPVVLIDTDMDRDLLKSADAKVSTYVGIDNYEGGKKVSKTVCAKLPKGSEVAIIGGSVGQTNVDARCKGYRDAATEAGMTVVAELSTNWSPDDGYVKAQNILKAYPNVKAIFTVNNTIYSGAYKASKDLGKQVIMGCFDCDDATMKSINAGELECTLSQDSDSMTDKAVETINKLLSGGAVEANTVSDAKLIVKQ